MEPEEQFTIQKSKANQFQLIGWSNGAPAVTKKAFHFIIVYHIQII